MGTAEWLHCRAFSIKLSAPIAGITMILYGCSTHYRQFVLCELGLALATGLVSGVDTALLLDTLKADGRDKDFVRLSQRLGYCLAVPLVGLLVDRTNLSIGFVVTGLACSGLAFIALSRLHRLHTFHERR